MIGCLPTQALAFLAVFVYATHATQAIAFEWKPGFRPRRYTLQRRCELCRRQLLDADNIKRWKPVAITLITPAVYT